MFTTTRWAATDEALGVSLTLTSSATGVATHAARALHQRHGVEEQDARTQVQTALHHVFGLEPPETFPTPTSALASSGGVTVDLSDAAAWLRAVRLDASHQAFLHSAAADTRAQGPRIHLTGGQYDWRDFVVGVGLDHALWARLLSASKAQPYVIAHSFADLTSRTDANPLAQVRRAHAALVRRVETCLSAQNSPHQPSDTPTALHTALALADRAAYDAHRTARPRPLVLALQTLANAATRYLELTPVTRTDLPLSEAARRVLAQAMAAAAVTAPVPY